MEVKQKTVGSMALGAAQRNWTKISFLVVIFFPVHRGILVFWCTYK
jgi:hypothetical protein